MSYVDYEYYKDTFKGTLDEDTAIKLLNESSDQVDRLTYGRIRKRGFSNLTEYQQELIKKATCYQADFISSYGEYLNMPLSGFSAGDISLSFNKDNQGAGGIIADKKTLDYLAQTGLSSRRL
nr:MAG TPA: Head Tail Connector Protein [Caudoviricetes sp.]